MLPRCRCTRAGGSSAFSAAMKSRRVAIGASADRFRQTSTTLEASALDPMPIIRLASSVRIGQVPVIPKPALIKASRNVSHPVLETPRSFRLSDCLNA